MVLSSRFITQKTFESTLCIILFLSALFMTACGLPSVDMFSMAPGPLHEVTLDGRGKHKVVVISITGEINDQPEKGLLSQQAGMLQEVIARLQTAGNDPNVRALVLKVDSPGGSVTASDILYNEIVKFKERSNAVVVACMMGVAASGGYYVSLPADYIIAHPTTVTGSIGVIFIRPQVQDLMEKIGVGVSVSKSGTLKDMGSPFRETTDVEQALFDSLVNYFSQRFLTLVQQHRTISPEALAQVKTAKVYNAQDAMEAGLIDAVGYLDNALARAKGLAGLPQDARVVVYRRADYPNDNVYNTLEAAAFQQGGVSLVNVDLLNVLPSSRSGFYYLWWPAEN